MKYLLITDPEISDEAIAKIWDSGQFEWIEDNKALKTITRRNLQILKLQYMKNFKFNSS